MEYEVHVVADDALPAGMHHLIVQETDGNVLLLLNGPVAACWLDMQRLEDMVDPNHGPTISYPALRAV